MSKCAVNGCKAKYGMGLRFFRAPSKEPGLRQDWVEAVNNEEWMKNGKSDQLYNKNFKAFFCYST